MMKTKLRIFLCFLKRSSANRVKVNVLAVCVLALLASSVSAKDPLQEFKEVTTRGYASEEHGFSISHPYEWTPGANPLTSSDFYVGAPFAMPSMWINVLPRTDDSKHEDVLSPQLLAAFPGYEIVEQSEMELSNTTALRTRLKWVTNDAGKHFIRTDIISLFAEDGHFLLVINQFDRETQWTPRLEAMLMSLKVEASI